MYKKIVKLYYKLVVVLKSNKIIILTLGQCRSDLCYEQKFYKYTPFLFLAVSIKIKRAILFPMYYQLFFRVQSLLNMLLINN